MSRRSVRFVLTAWYAAFLAATFLLTGAGVWWGIRKSIVDTADKDLRIRLRAIRTELDRQSPTSDILKVAERLKGQTDFAAGGARFRLADAKGSWMYQSAPLKGWDANAPDLQGVSPRGVAKTQVIGNNPYRVLSAPIRDGMVQIFLPIDEYYELVDGFAWIALVASPILLLLSSVGGYWMSGRALLPVDRITRTAQEIGAHNLSERLPLRGADDELDRLSLTLNSMLGRLESAFNRITQFTTDASHELRTPVAIIRTTAELSLSKDRGESEYKEALTRILTESERTTRLIDDLMSLARSDVESEAAEFSPLDLVRPVRAACAEVRVLAEGGRLLLDADLPGRCPVSGDEQSLRRLFLNLLENAVHYTPAGGQIRVTMRTEESAAARWALVEVRDSGIGIPPADLPHIFERFYRSAKDRSRRTGGFGLGLAIAKGIAVRHQGEIEVESELHSGSVFRVKLPLAS